MPIRKSNVGGVTPSGTTADRPASPAIGDTFFNGTLGVQEIYTSSGWLPATGANDFNVVLNGEDTSVTLDKEYFAGAYTITSALSDTSFDIYLFDTQGNSAGYTNTPSINATSNFNKIVVLGGQAGDLLSFSYKTTFTTASTTDEVAAGPIIKSISIADLPNIDDTTVITGINFAEDIHVTFTGTNEVALSAKSVVRSSATSLLVTRPDTLIEDYSPYTITVTNPGVTAPSGTNGHISTNAITAGGDPVWVTASDGLAEAASGLPYSATVEATDPDGGTITYSIASGSLPNGLSLNSSTGEIGGTATVVETLSFIIAATDSGGNVTNRSFDFVVGYPGSGGTITESGGYVYHTFTGNGTFTAASDISIESLVVGGGGGGGRGEGVGPGDGAGGGGAGGYLPIDQILPAGSYVIEIGGGGTGSSSSSIRGASGSNTTFGSLYTALGGGGGGSDPNNSSVTTGLSGGSGGGASAECDTPGRSGGSGLQPSSQWGGFGNPGGSASGCTYRNGAGGGGAGSAGSNGNTASTPDGGAGLQWLDGSFYAGGGGGGYGSSGSGPGGNGGSGIGGSSASNGAASTGSGGGGGASPGGSGGSGSSGIVIIRYPI